MSDFEKLQQRIFALSARASAKILTLAKAENSFAPPDSVQSAARRGLEMRRRWKRGGLSNEQASEQGIGSGVQRATNLANGSRISSRVIGQMVGFFSRHAKNYRPDTKEPDGGPTAGTIAWLLWGGNAGKAWAESVHRRLKDAPVEKAAAPVVKRICVGTCPCAGAIQKALCDEQGCLDERNGIIWKQQPRWPDGRFASVKKDGEGAASSGPTVSAVHVPAPLGDSPKRKKPIEKSDPKTPAKPSERVSGSDKNPEGSASGTRGGIDLDEAVEASLKAKVAEHNDKHPEAGKNASLGALKAVWRRGAGAFSTSHRPGVGRQQWAMARVNAYLTLLRTGSPANPKYVTDNDLLPSGHPRSSKDSK